MRLEVSPVTPVEIVFTVEVSAVRLDVTDARLVVSVPTLVVSAVRLDVIEVRVVVIEVRVVAIAATAEVLAIWLFTWNDVRYQAVLPLSVAEILAA